MSAVHINAIIGQWRKKDNDVTSNLTSLLLIVMHVALVHMRCLHWREPFLRCNTLLERVENTDRKIGSQIGRHMGILCCHGLVLFLSFQIYYQIFFYHHQFGCYWSLNDDAEGAGRASSGTLGHWDLVFPKFKVQSAFIRETPLGYMKTMKIHTRISRGTKLRSGN